MIDESQNYIFEKTLKVKIYLLNIVCELSFFLRVVFRFYLFLIIKACLEHLDKSTYKVEEFAALMCREFRVIITRHVLS